MRHGNGNNNNRRNRNRNNNNNNRRNNAPGRSQVFDSNGPDVRIRGTAHQIVEKYEALAKDANSSGDRSLAENYLQHAEHYQRMIVKWDAETKERNEANNAEKPATQNAQEAKQDEKASSEKPKRTRRKPAAKEQEEDLGLPVSMLTEAPVEEKETA